MNIEWVPVLAAFCFLYLGMLALNLAMDRNTKLVFNTVFTAKKNNVLKMLGWCGLLVALALCIYVWGGIIGITTWCGIASFVVGLLIFIQTYSPRWSLHLASLWSAMAGGALLFRVFGLV